MLKHLKTDLGVTFVTKLPLTHEEIVSDMKRPGNETKYAFKKLGDNILEIVLDSESS